MTLRILDKLYASDTNLTKADLALLEYVKAKGLDACNAPISEIAKSCGVSHATVTRFARKFGFDSLQAFKIALAQELGPSDNQGHLIAVNISYDESSEVTARKLDELSTSTIHHTVQLIDHEVLRKITQRLTNAHRLFFIGKGNSGFAASDSASAEFVYDDDGTLSSVTLRDVDGRLVAQASVASLVEQYAPGGSLEDVYLHVFGEEGGA